LRFKINDSISSINTKQIFPELKNQAFFAVSNYKNEQYFALDETN